MASEKKKVDDTTLPLLTPKLPRMKDRRGGSDSLVKLMQRIQTGQPERRAFRDRRATPRVAVQLDIEAEEGGETVVMRSHDLSTFGVGVKSGPTLKKGSRITIRLFLPDEPTTPIELKAEVLGPFGEHGGVRMKFINPPVEAVRRIHRLLTRGDFGRVASVVSDFERRRSVRVNVSLPVEVRDERGFSFHSTRDISATGCFFDRAIPHAVGARVALSFGLPGDSRTIRCEGEVVNVPDKKGYGMGIRFLNISPADAQRLDAFARQLLEGENR